MVSDVEASRLAPKLGHKLDFTKFEKQIFLGFSTICFLMVIVFAYRNIHVRGYWNDEFWTYFFSRNDIAFSETFSNWTKDTHPPLYSLSLYIMESIKGMTITEKRIANFIPFTAFYVFSMYTIFTNRKSATFAFVSFIAASGLWSLNYYLTEARSYLSIIVIGFMSFTSYHRLMNTKSSSADISSEIISIVILIFLGINLHYTSAPIFASTAIIFSIFLILKDRRKDAIILAATVFISMLSLLIFMWLSRSILSQSSAFWANKTISSLFFEFTVFSFKSNTLIFVFAIAGFFIFLNQPKNLRAMPANSAFAVFCLISCIMTFAIYSVLNLIKPIGLSRYIIILDVFILMTATSFAVIALEKYRWGLPLVALSAIFLLSWRMDKYIPEENWFATARLIQKIQEKCPDTHVYMVPRAKLSTISKSINNLNDNKLKMGNISYIITAKRFNIRLSDSSIMPTLGSCPVVFWTEHVGNTPISPTDVAENMRLTGPTDLLASAKVVYGHSGLIIVYPAIG